VGYWPQLKSVPALDFANIHQMRGCHRFRLLLTVTRFPTNLLSLACEDSVTIGQSQLVFQRSGSDRLALRYFYVISGQAGAMEVHRLALWSCTAPSQSRLGNAARPARRGPILCRTPPPPDANMLERKSIRSHPKKSDPLRRSYKRQTPRAERNLIWRSAGSAVEVSKRLQPHLAGYFTP
jgi:hypothetical protein